MKITTNWLDFDLFIYANCLPFKEERKKEKKWNSYHVPDIVLRGKDTVKKKSPYPGGS